MKMKLSITVLLAGLLMTACGTGDVLGPDNGTSSSIGTTTVDTREFLNDSTLKLVDEGDSLLDATVDSYSVMTNPIARDMTRAAADFMLCPYGADGNTTFSQRMAGFCTGDDNVVKMYSLIQNASNLDYQPEGSASQGRRALLRAQTNGGLSLNNSGYYTVQYLLDNRQDIVRSIPIIGGFVACFIGGKTKEEKNQERIMNQLNRIGVSLNQFWMETRRSFRMVNLKLDAVLGSLASLRGEVNFLHGDLQGNIVEQKIKDIKLNFEAFLTTYHQQTLESDRSNAVYEYYVVSHNFAADLSSFISCARDVKDWAVQFPGNSGYTDWFLQDSSLSNLVPVLAGSALSSDNQPADYSYWHKFNYPNPKWYVNMSMGDLDFLSRMMLGRLQLNAVLKGGADLKASNTIIAQDLLNELNDSGLKQSLMDAARRMFERLNYYLNAVDEDFPFFYGIASTGNWVLGGAGGTINVWWYYGDETAKETIRKHFYKAYLSYLGPMIARLVALEVKLKSYL